MFLVLLGTVSNNWSTVVDVLISNHKIALCRGSPVFLSQTTVVSLWFVTPIATMSSAAPPRAINFSTAFSIHSSTTFKIDFASWSAHPGAGVFITVSFWWKQTTSCVSACGIFYCIYFVIIKKVAITLKIINLAEDVPSSIAPTSGPKFPDIFNVIFFFIINLCNELWCTLTLLLKSSLIN